MGKTFHDQMWRALDDATYRGETIPHNTHYAMRRALRNAQMRGGCIMSERELARATFEEMAKGN